MKRIIIADDERFLRDLARTILEKKEYTDKRGFTYIETDTGEGAWEAYVKALDRSIDPVMILDNRMGNGITGREVAERIRKGYDNMPPDSKTPIIFCSSSFRPEEIEEIREELDVDYVEKPYRLEDLVSAVERQIERGEKIKSRTMQDYQLIK